MSSSSADFIAIRLSSSVDFNTTCLSSSVDFIYHPPFLLNRLHFHLFLEYHLQDLSNINIPCHIMANKQARHITIQYHLPQLVISVNMIAPHLCLLHRQQLYLQHHPHLAYLGRALMFIVDQHHHQSVLLHHLFHGLKMSVRLYNMIFIIGWLSPLMRMGLPPSYVSAHMITESIKPFYNDAWTRWKDISYKTRDQIYYQFTTKCAWEPCYENKIMPTF